jgi:hypothetical protein
MNADGMKRPASPALAGLKVLVVEDEAIIAFDLEGTLRELGCVVLPIAPSVAEALAVSRQSARKQPCSTSALPMARSHRWRRRWPSSACRSLL